MSIFLVKVDTPANCLPYLRSLKFYSIFCPSEVVTALTKSRSMYERWCELHTDASGYTKEEVDWTTTELRNGLRSIEWDLEDLEETIGIVESNPKKFKLDESEIGCRKRFITATREEVAQMRDQVVADTGKTTGQNKKTTVASLMNSGLNSVAAATGNNGTKYSKLSNEIDSPSHVMSSANHGGSELNVDLGQHQSLMLRREDDSFDRLKNNVGTLKSITSSIHREREEHAV